MLSICIPIYNCDVRNLIRTLEQQVRSESLACQFVLVDDGSSEEYRRLNRSALDSHKYVELPANGGRAAARNRCVELATTEYLLFLDADVVITSPRFLCRYVRLITAHQPDVICGGRVYPLQPPARIHLLRWSYGSAREAKDPTSRQQWPYDSFMTNNFVVRKSVFETIHFDETLRHYGHEDTLFGIELKRENRTIMHIDNPVFKLDQETNADFLEKTTQALQNLIRLERRPGLRSDLIQSVHLLRFNAQYRLAKPLLTALGWMLIPLLRFFLKRGYFTLRMFDLYRLLLLEKLRKKTP
ncbi:MAG TPA: glycosyltransferase family 2 protein [Luteibaculaceae bacterium]|nr:glycosyltransferase family 2 protein [Luteibaculaceae bacterium]